MQAPLAANARDTIVETVDQLSLLLDIPHPWDLVIHDPSGLTIVKPDDDGGVEVVLKGGGEVAGVA